jgi:hypothetical protein
MILSDLASPAEARHGSAGGWQRFAQAGWKPGPLFEIAL